MARKQSHKGKNGKSNLLPHLGKKGGMSTFMVGAAGAVLGAAVGAASAVALSHAPTRGKITNTVGEITEYAADTMDGLDRQTRSLYRGNKPQRHKQVTSGGKR